jgi:hypothetical protein
MLAYHEAKTVEIDQLHHDMQQLQDDLDAAHARWAAASHLPLLGSRVCHSSSTAIVSEQSAHSK